MIVLWNGLFAAMLAAFSFIHAYMSICMLSVATGSAYTGLLAAHTKLHTVPAHPLLHDPSLS